MSASARFCDRFTKAASISRELLAFFPKGGSPKTGHRSRHDEPPWFATLNLTRPHRAIAQESRFQGLGINSYYYPYMIYNVSHERNVFPKLGIPSDEDVVPHALAKIEVGLKVVERELAHGKDYLLGSELTLAEPAAKHLFV